MSRSTPQDSTIFSVGAAGAEGQPAGKIILYPGSVSSLYRLEAGLVRLHTVDTDGFGVTLRYVKPGGYFGEEALSGEERTYFAEAVSDSVTRQVDVSELSEQELLEVARYLSLSLGAMNRAVLRLAARPLKARVAAELLELTDSAIATRSSVGEPVIHLTHDDLAAAVGSVRETVTKVIGELVRSGALEAGYAKITVRDSELLSEIAGS